MSLSKIGNEHWDFVDATGSETRLPPPEAKKPAVDFPTNWRVFGPLKDIAQPTGRQRLDDRGEVMALKDLKTIPERLVIRGEMLEGRDVVLDGDIWSLTRAWRKDIIIEEPHDGRG